MKKIAVLTSGGDAPGMNAMIRAVVKGGHEQGMEVYGVMRGYSGLINGAFKLLTDEMVDGVGDTGGTILKSARCLEMKTPEGRAQAVANAQQMGIEGLVAIGGDGTLAGATLLSEMGLKVIGLPGTIDNDIAYTETAIGFDTACNQALNMLRAVRDTAYSHDRVMLSEVMGRDCGAIALRAGIALGAEAIVVPEGGLDLVKLAARLKHCWEHNGRNTAVAVISEGMMEPRIINDAVLGPAGEFMRGRDQKATIKEFVQVITAYTGLDVRGGAFGHTQRGGLPTVNDLAIAACLAQRAVELLSEGKTNLCVGTKRGQIYELDIQAAQACPKKHDPLLDLARTTGQLVEK